MEEFARAAAGRYLRHITQEAIDGSRPLLLDTDEFTGLLEKMMGRVLRRRKPGPEKKDGGRN
jgi:hypothetical protein